MTEEQSIPSDLTLTSSAEVNATRIELELERNPLPAGEPTWVTTRVTNTGTDDLVWFHDGCAITIGVTGAIEGAVLRSGLNLENPQMAWKGYLLDLTGPAPPPATIYFTPEPFVGRGSVGCADIGIQDRIPPGGSIQQRAQWDGLVEPGLVPPPSGRVDLVGTLRYTRRASDPEPDDITEKTVSVNLDAWIVGDDPTLLHPGEAVDAALAEPRLTAILADRELRNGNEPVLRYDISRSAYEIGMLESGDLEVAIVHLVVIDAHTGELVEFVERPWDYDVDGFP